MGGTQESLGKKTQTDSPGAHTLIHQPVWPFYSFFILSWPHLSPSGSSADPFSQRLLCESSPALDRLVGLYTYRYVVFNPFSKIKRISFWAFGGRDNVVRGLFHANGQVGKKRQNAGSPDYTKSCWIQNGGVIWSVSLVRAGCRRERILQQQQPEKSKEKEKSCRQKYKVCPVCAE